MNQLRERIGEAAGTDIVNEEDRVLGTVGGAAIDHFLAAPFHLGIAALHGCKIEVRRTRALSHRRGGAPTQADQHCGATKHHNPRPGRKALLGFVARTNIPETARQHDRLVIAPDLASRRARCLLAKSTKITGHIRATELIIESSASDRTFQHDFQRRRHPVGAAEILLPWLFGPRDPKMRDRESGQSGFRSGAQTGCTLVPNLSTRTSSGARKGCNCGRMIMRLDLHQNRDRFLVRAIDVIARVGKEAPPRGAHHHRRIIGIGRQNSLGRLFGGIPNHRKE